MYIYIYIFRCFNQFFGVSSQNHGTKITHKKWIPPRFWCQAPVEVYGPLPLEELGDAGSQLGGKLRLKPFKSDVLLGGGFKWSLNRRLLTKSFHNPDINQQIPL